MPKPHSREFRDCVVAVARRGDAPIDQIAKDFEISESCLRHWLHRADVEDGVGPGTTSARSAELREYVNSTWPHYGGLSWHRLRGSNQDVGAHHGPALGMRYVAAVPNPPASTRGLRAGTTLDLECTSPKPSILGTAQPPEGDALIANFRELADILGEEGRYHVLARLYPGC